MNFKYQKIFGVACLFSLMSSMALFAEVQPKHPVLEQLDLDGEMVLFLNTETVEQHVLEQIDIMSEMMLASIPVPEARADLLDGLTRLKAGLAWSGLLSLDSFGMSMKPVEGTLSRVIELAQYSDADAQKPIWRVCFSEPTLLKGIDYVPADSVYAVNSTTSLSEAWKVAMEAVASYCSPEQSAAVQQQLALAQMMLGTNIAAITESMDDEILISLQLSETRTVMFPSGTNELTIAEPNLLIGLKTKSPLFGQILLTKIAQAQMPLTKSEHGAATLYTLNIPSPSPVPVQLTLMVAEDYLLIGSTQAVVIQALDCQKNKTGLVSTPLYQKLLKDAPEKVSSISFVSPRFMQTYMDVLKQASSSGQPEMDDMFDAMMGSYTDFYAGGYSLKTPTGIYFRGYADYGGVKPVEMLASAYAGMFSAIAIPSVMNAYTVSQEKAKARNIAEVQKAKGVLTLPVVSGLPGAMGLTDTNLSLDSGAANENLMKALSISNMSELDVGDESIVVGTLTKKASYKAKQ